MIKYTLSDTEITWPEYTIDESNSDIIGPNPDKKDFAAYSIIREFAALGQAGSAGEKAHVLLENLYSFAETDGQEGALVFKDLGLPKFYDGLIYLETNGPISDPEFTIQLRLPEFISSQGILKDRQFSLWGCIITFNDGKIEKTCRPSLFRLVKELDKLKSYIPNTLDNLLLSIARIKKIAIEANAKFDNILESEQIILPDQIKISVEGSEKEVQIIPQIDIPGLAHDEFSKKFDKRINVDSKYNFEKPDTPGRIRLVLTPQQKKALSIIKNKYRKITDSDTLRLLIENPPIEFDDANLDVSELYSDRVKGLGLYRPKSYPFISPYKTEWVAGILIEDIDGKRGIGIKSEEDLKELQNAIDEAEQKNSDYIIFHSEKVDLSTAKAAQEEATRRLHGSDEEKRANFSPNSKVLIIKENIENLEYKYSFKKKEPIDIFDLAIPNLDQSITLKVFQQHGISQLYSLYKSGYPGGILADDMGLGKTLQVLSFLELVSEEHKNFLACIVCPVGLINNWMTEYRKFFPLGKLVFLNLKNENIDINEISTHRANFSNIVMLFSYEFLRRNQLAICAISWDIAVLDEAQRIKTPGTLITNAAKALKSNFKIAITGTPTENSFYDLWCISDFCLPGLLGSAKDFSQKYAISKEDSEQSIIAKGEQLRKELGSCFIRRIKEDALKDLPPKYQSDNPDHSSHFINTPTVLVMPDAQVLAYNGILREHLLIKKEDKNKPKEKMLGLLYKMKIISEHPTLVENFNSIDIAQPDDSAKVLSLFYILDYIKSKKEKAIIFAEYRQTQRMLASMIYARYSIKVNIINGETPVGSNEEVSSNNRLAIIQRFNNSNGFNVIIMSPIAAGVGLNVTGANHVIHFSRHWNPAKEEQATDRAYRIGQTRPVYVYYLIAKHPDPRIRSFDENLAGLLAAKRNISKAVLFPSELIEAKMDDVINATFAGEAYIS